jgi:hypothetical protein
MPTGITKKKNKPSVSGAGIIKVTNKGTIGTTGSTSNKKEMRQKVKEGKKIMKQQVKTAKANGNKHIKGGGVYWL